MDAHTVGVGRLGFALARPSFVCLGIVITYTWDARMPLVEGYKLLAELSDDRHLIRGVVSHDFSGSVVHISELGVGTQMLLKVALVVSNQLS